MNKKFRSTSRSRLRSTVRSRRKRTIMGKIDASKLNSRDITILSVLGTRLDELPKLSGLQDRLSSEGKRALHIMVSGDEGDLENRVLRRMFTGSASRHNLRKLRIRETFRRRAAPPAGADLTDIKKFYKQEWGVSI